MDSEINVNLLLSFKDFVDQEPMTRVFKALKAPTLIIL